MNVQCLECESTYKVDASMVPQQGEKAKCPKCENLLPVELPVADSGNETSGDNQKSFCPFCGEQNPFLNQKCDHCSEALISHVSAQSTAHAGLPEVQQLGDGHFIFSCAYSEAWEMTRTAMKACGVRVKKADIHKGALTGKCKLGINPFGITVTSTFNSAENNTTMLRISAHLTDAFDTTGVCKKKVAQISAGISKHIDSGEQNLPVPVAVPVQNQAPSAVLEKASTIDSKTKKCPFCAEEILSDAIKCKHCHSDILKNASTPPKSNFAQGGQNQSDNTSIHLELKNFSKHDQVHCMECGYEGAMGIVPGTKEVPFLLSWPVFIFLLLTGIGIIAAAVLGILRGMYTKHVYYCPAVSNISGRVSTLFELAPGFYPFQGDHKCRLSAKIALRLIKLINPRFHLMGPLHHARSASLKFALNRLVVKRQLKELRIPIRMISTKFQI